MERKIIIIIRVVSILLCALIVLFIAIPHHVVTENQAVEAACEYFLYRMDDSEMNIESCTVDYYNCSESANNPFERMIRYWNPKVAYYEVKIKTNKSQTVFPIRVDTYTGYIYDASDAAIMWKREWQE